MLQSLLAQLKAGKRRIKRVQYYQERKHLLLCLYFYRRHIHRGCRKVLLWRNNPNNGESVETLPVSSSPHHSAPRRILFPEITQHFEEAWRIHLPFKFCYLHYNQVQPLSTSAVWGRRIFLNFPLLPSKAEISRDLWLTHLLDFSGIWLTVMITLERYKINPLLIDQKTNFSFRNWNL